MEFVLALKVMANGAGLPTTGKDSPVSSPALLTAHLEIVVGGRILAQEAGTAPEKFLGTGRGGKKIRALRAKIFRAATNYRWSGMFWTHAKRPLTIWFATLSRSSLSG
jgi:hypothetical protein